MAIVRSALVHTTAAAAFLLRRPPRPCVRILAATRRRPTRPCMRMMATTSPVEVAVPGGLTLRGTRYASDASDGGRWLLLRLAGQQRRLRAAAPKLCDADGAAFADVVALDPQATDSDHRAAIIRRGFARRHLAQTNSGARAAFNVAGHSWAAASRSWWLAPGRTIDALQRSARERSPGRRRCAFVAAEIRRGPVGGSRRLQGRHRRRAAPRREERHGRRAIHGT